MFLHFRYSCKRSVDTNTVFISRATLNSGADRNIPLMESSNLLWLSSAYFIPSLPTDSIPTTPYKTIFFNPVKSSNCQLLFNTQLHNNMPTKVVHNWALSEKSRNVYIKRVIVTWTFHIEKYNIAIIRPIHIEIFNVIQVDINEKSYLSDWHRKWQNKHIELIHIELKDVL